MTATHFLENDLWHGPVEAVSIISSTCLLPPNLLEVWCHSAGPLYFILLPPGLWCPIDCPRSTSATAVLSLGFCTLALGRDGGNVGYLGVGPVPWGLPHGFPSCCPHDFVTATKKQRTLVMMVSSLRKPQPQYRMLRNTFGKIA